jgi:hypothetical protein
MRSRRTLVLLALVLAVAGCAMARHREQVRRGFLTRGLHRDAFVKEWGQPARTYSVEASEGTVNVDPWTGTWRVPIYEIWEYPDRATCLTFEGVRLIEWQQNRTDCKPAPRPPRRPPGPPPPYPPYPR